MDFKNQWDDESKKSDDPAKDEPKNDTVDLESAVESSNDSTTETPSTTDEKAVDLEKADIGTESNPKPSVVASVYPTPTEPTYAGNTIGASVQDTANENPHKARRFLIAYITTVFSALSILSGTAWLGYVLIDEAFGPKSKQDIYSSFLDFAPLYISLMASLIVFGLIYIVASRYVAKSVSDDTIGLKDWRAYKVVYAFFSALLIATAASIIAGLVYIPLAQLMIADDLESKRILVQVLASVHALVWIAVLIWQERLVKKAKQSWLQGFVVVAGVAVVVVLTGIFPVGSKTDERYDKRVVSDLSQIESAISTYKANNSNKLPVELSELDLTESQTVKDRLKNYKYTIKNTPQTTANSQPTVGVKTTVLGNNSQSSSSQYQLQSEDDYSNMSDEEYYNALYDSMYENAAKNTQTRQTYEICATFRTDTTSSEKSSGSSIFETLAGGTANSQSFYSHKAGEVCFNRT